MRQPKYRRHSSRDMGFAERDGHRTYFPGKFNSQESVAAYRAFLLESPTDKTTAQLPPGRLRVKWLVIKFLEWAKARYAKTSTATRGEYANLKHAMTPLLTNFGHSYADQFGPRNLKELQRILAGKKRARGYVNTVVSKIKRAFKWAASEELIPINVYLALDTVQGLRAGETIAKETAKRRPVEWKDVESVLPFLSKTIAEMVAFQWHTGCRSDSLCRATPSQFIKGAGGWEWRPRHKTEHLGRELVIPIGPRALAIIAKRLKLAPAAPLFSPKEINKNRRYGKQYTSGSYRQAIVRAIEAENDRKEEGEPKLRVWFPHLIRHARGEGVRQSYGLEAAQAILGHDSIDATQVYSSRRFALARTVADETG